MIAPKSSIYGLPDIDADMFPGVKIKVSHLASITGRGWYNNRQKTIFLPKGAKTSYAQHEYGHYLQSQQLSAIEYSRIEKASLANALLQFLPGSKKHDTFWTETDANRRAIAFFGPNSAIARFGIWPVV
ncbi:MAG: hypothetical protein IT236_11290 [Bacteroidia bacterium]|nr:hypothetical protein [Bacteroidia bacterium]